MGKAMNGGRAVIASALAAAMTAAMLPVGVASAVGVPGAGRAGAGDAAQVMAAGATSTYATLAEAVAAANAACAQGKAGVELKLLRNVKVGKYKAPTDGSMTRLSASAAAGVELTGGYKLESESSNGGVKVDGAGHRIEVVDVSPDCTEGAGSVELTAASTPLKKGDALLTYGSKWGTNSISNLELADESSSGVGATVSVESAGMDGSEFDDSDESKALEVTGVTADTLEVDANGLGDVDSPVTGRHGYETVMIESSSMKSVIATGAGHSKGTTRVLSGVYGDVSDVMVEGGTYNGTVMSSRLATCDARYKINPLAADSGNKALETSKALTAVRGDGGYYKLLTTFAPGNITVDPRLSAGGDMAVRNSLANAAAPAVALVVHAADGTPSVKGLSLSGTEQVAAAKAAMEQAAPTLAVRAADKTADAIDGSTEIGKAVSEIKPTAIGGAVRPAAVLNVEMTAKFGDIEAALTPQGPVTYSIPVGKSLLNSTLRAYEMTADGLHLAPIEGQSAAVAEGGTVVTVSTQSPRIVILEDGTPAQALCANGHMHGAGIVEWDGDKATAKFTCTVCGKVEARECEVAKATVKAATCTEAGEARLTATATSSSGAKAEASRTEAVAALGHKWAVAGTETDAEGTMFTKRVCENDPGHVQWTNGKTGAVSDTAAGAGFAGESAATKALRERAEKLQAQSDSLSKELAARKSELEAAKKLESQLTESVGTNEGRVKTLEEQIAKIRADIEAKKALAEQAQKRIADLESGAATPAPEEKPAAAVSVSGCKALKAKKLKKRAASFKAVKAAGAKVRKTSGSSRLAITSGGTAKVKKGTRKGTYTMRISVAAPETEKAAGTSLAATVTVVVK